LPRRSLRRRRVRGKKKEFQRQARKETQRVWWLCITLRALALKLFFRHRLNRVSDSKAIHARFWIPLECLRHSGNDKGEKPSALRRCTYKTLCALGERSLRVLGVNEFLPVVTRLDRGIHRLLTEHPRSEGINPLLTLYFSQYGFFLMYNGGK
jgi:hypothetical protein